MYTPPPSLVPPDAAAARFRRGGIVFGTIACIAALRLVLPLGHEIEDMLTFVAILLINIFVPAARGDWKYDILFTLGVIFSLGGLVYVFHTYTALAIEQIFMIVCGIMSAGSWIGYALAKHSEKRTTP